MNLELKWFVFLDIFILTISFNISEDINCTATLIKADIDRKKKNEKATQTHSSRSWLNTRIKGRDYAEGFKRLTEWYTNMRPIY